MKIIFSLNHFLPENVAGTEVYTFSLAKSLQELGIAVAVLIPGFDQEQGDSYEHEGIRVIRYAERSESSREMIMGKLKPEGLDAYRHILERECPSIMHFHELAAGRGISIHHVQAVAAMGIKMVLTCHLSTYSCQTGNLVYKDAQLCDGIIRTGKCTACAYHARGIGGIKAVMLEHSAKLLQAAGINASGWNSTLGTALGFPFVVDKKKKELLQYAQLFDKVVVLTRWYQQMLEANGVTASKIRYCPQGLTGSSVAVARQTGNLPIRLVFIGRVSKYKGVHLLLEAIQQLPKAMIVLDIYGPVTEDEYGQECIALSQDNDHVQWKGTIASDKVIGMLSGYDVLCLPSTFSEMSPLVIQEAFAAGIPVLASNVYGNSEQVTDGVNGWLFDFKSVASLAEKLKRLIDNPQLINAARNHIPATRSFADLAKEHVDLYQQIVLPE